MENINHIFTNWSELKKKRSHLSFQFYGMESRNNPEN